MGPQHWCPSPRGLAKALSTRPKTVYTGASKDAEHGLELELVEASGLAKFTSLSGAGLMRGWSREATLDQGPGETPARSMGHGARLPPEMSTAVPRASGAAGVCAGSRPCAHLSSDSLF